jgi:hypothetical protein
VPPKNLLPNAAFELEFGDHVPTDWADYYNPLTIKLLARHQIPKVSPRSEIVEDAMHGERAARVETESIGGRAIAHLTSAMVSVQPCTPHSISVYAKCEAPAATLEMGLWTRPLDFTKTPDSLSYPIPISTTWRRYEFTCCTDELEDCAVVDFKVTSENDRTVVWFNGAQLEQGPRASEFTTRREVEARVEGRRGQLTHLNDEPLKLYLTTYNHTSQPRNEPITLKVSELVTNREIFNHTITEPVPTGRSERTLSLPFPFVGEFRAQLFTVGGEQISTGDYIFVNHPVFEETYQAVLYTRCSAVHQLPAERSVLPWTNDRNWYADPPATLTVTDDDAIHVQTSDGHTVMRTRDGGRTWDNPQVTKPINTVLRDGVFVAAELEDEDIVVYKSDDLGRTWGAIGRIDQARQPQMGGIEQLRNGELIVPIGIEARAAAGQSTVHAFRSTDGGQTWSAGAPICPGGEPQILELQSGRLLAFCRNNPRVPIDDLQRPFRNEGPWLLWQRLGNHRTLSSYTKRITLAESDDGGATWHSQRPATFLLEEMHGGAVQLPDERIVFLYTHRGPHYRGGERAKVSCDEGRTWCDELYYLTATPSYPGYSGSCVLPPHLADGVPGTILTVVGERSEGNWGSEGPPTPEGFKYMPRMQAIRWRPVDS